MYREPWQERAACNDHPTPDLFYPAPADWRTLYRARAVCAGCPVSAECLREAMLSEDEHGIRGGLTPNQRARLRKRQPA